MKPHPNPSPKGEGQDLYKSFCVAYCSMLITYFGIDYFISFATQKITNDQQNFYDD
jgi:hypothetical protein